MIGKRVIVETEDPNRFVILTVELDGCLKPTGEISIQLVGFQRTMTMVVKHSDLEKKVQELYD